MIIHSDRKHRVCDIRVTIRVNEESCQIIPSMIIMGTKSKMNTSGLCNVLNGSTFTSFHAGNGDPVDGKTGVLKGPSHRDLVGFEGIDRLLGR